MAYQLPSEQRCQHCGQRLPPEGLPDGVNLTKLQRRVWQCVTNWPGMSAHEIMDWVYGHDPHGGPEDENHMRVVINLANKRLRPHGVEINGRGGEGYRVEHLERENGRKNLRCA